MSTTTTATTEQLIINGVRTEASDGGTFDVFDPSTGERLASVAKATPVVRNQPPHVNQNAQPNNSATT